MYDSIGTKLRCVCVRWAVFAQFI